MDDIRFFMQKFNRTNQLTEVIPRKLFIKTSSDIFDFNKTKQITLFYKFKYNKEHLNAFTVLFCYYLAFTVVFN